MTSHPLDYRSLERAAQVDAPTALAVKVGVHPKTASRWRAAGYLSAVHADAAAIALGLHPSLIWPGWWQAEPETLTVDYVPLQAAAGTARPMELAAAFGVPRSTVWRWRRDGVVVVPQAAQAAASLGLDPLEVWGEDWPVWSLGLAA